MLEATIKTVKKAELKAAETVKAAREQAELIIEQAKADAALLKEKRVNEAKEKAQTDMNNAKKEGEKLLESTVLNVNQEITKLRESASQKEKEVIELLVSELF